MIISESFSSYRRVSLVLALGYIVQIHFVRLKWIFILVCLGSHEVNNRYCLASVVLNFLMRMFKGAVVDGYILRSSFISTWNSVSFSSFYAK